MPKRCQSIFNTYGSFDPIEIEKNFLREEVERARLDRDHGRMIMAANTLSQLHATG